MPDYKSLEFDTWLLQSLILAKVGGIPTRERVAAAADLLSKTPMADADLQDGLIRLAQRGLVQEGNGSYSVTAAVPPTLKWSEREKVRQLLSAETPPEAAKAETSGNLGKQAGVYVKRFQGFVSGLTKPKKE